MTADPRHTPVPSSMLLSISTNLADVASGVKSIKEDLLPPLAADTREARDKAREALQKVDTHVSDPEAHLAHRCDEKDRQARQDGDIAEAKGKLLEADAKISSTSKVLWWALGIVVAVGGTAVGFAISTSSGAAAAASELEDLDDVPEAVARHDVQIKALEKAQAEDRATFIREVRKLPAEVSTKVRSSTPALEQVDDAVDELPLRPSERRQLLELLDRARRREEFEREARVREEGEAGGNGG